MLYEVITIDPAVDNTLFERGVTTTSEEGHGYGMYLIYRYVSHAGGHIILDEAEPMGAMISLFIPLKGRITSYNVCYTKLLREHQLKCVVDSSGDALKAAVTFGNLELLKPNQSELSELTGHTLEDPNDVINAARALIQQGAAKRIVVSLGPQGALGVDAEQAIHVVPPPVKKMSTVGAGDSMVGAMVLKIAEDAPFADIVRYGVAAGTAATMGHGTKLCSKKNTESLYAYLKKHS